MNGTLVVERSAEDDESYAHLLTRFQELLKVEVVFGPKDGKPTVADADGSRKVPRR